MIKGYVAIIDDEDTDLCPRGNGKTCSLTFDLLLYYKRGYEVWTNYYTSFSKKIIGFQEMIDTIREIRKREDENKIPYYKRRKIVLGVSELQKLISSLGSSTNQVLYVDAFANQLRKLDVDLLYDTQVFKSINIKLRRHSENIRIPMKFHLNGKQCNFDRCDKPHIILIYSWKPFLKKPIRKIKAYEVGKLYDSREFIEDELKLPDKSKKEK